MKLVVLMLQDGVDGQSTVLVLGLWEIDEGYVESHEIMAVACSYKKLVESSGLCSV